MCVHGCCFSVESRAGVEVGWVLTFVCPQVGVAAPLGMSWRLVCRWCQQQCFFPSWSGVAMFSCHLMLPCLKAPPSDLSTHCAAQCLPSPPSSLVSTSPPPAAPPCVTVASLICASGWLVLGASRLRYGVIRPLFDDVVKEVGTQEVGIHRRFLSDSSSLFLIYFLQLVILAMYLNQEQLKLVPLLAIIFAFGRWDTQSLWPPTSCFWVTITTVSVYVSRLVYWVAAAFGSSVRSFGFGLSFLPSVAMMVANFYFVFTVEAAGSIFSQPPPPEEILIPPDSRQRFWGWTLL